MFVPSVHFFGLPFLHKHSWGPPKHLQKRKTGAFQQRVMSCWAADRKNLRWFDFWDLIEPGRIDRSVILGEGVRDSHISLYTWKTRFQKGRIRSHSHQICRYVRLAPSQRQQKSKELGKIRLSVTGSQYHLDNILKFFSWVYQEIEDLCVNMNAVEGNLAVSPEEKWCVSQWKNNKSYY